MGDVLKHDSKTGVMATLFNDAGIKPCIRDWVNNNLRAGANLAAQLNKRKEWMPSKPAAEVEESSFIASIIIVSSISWRPCHLYFKDHIFQKIGSSHQFTRFSWYSITVNMAQ